MKPINIIVTLGILIGSVLSAADFHESSDITIDDLGWKKIVPADHSATEKDSAWIITCKVTEGDKVRMHRTYGYYAYRHAIKASLILINPETIGIDFKGTTLRFAGESISLPESYPILTESKISNNGQTHIGYFLDRSDKVIVEYMVETIPKRELETISGKPQYQERSETVTVIISPPREPIANK